MVLADRAPRERNAVEATPVDGLAIGFAQAAALAPGVSRNGSTLAAARARGFRRAQANLLSGTVALPVITAAAVRKAVTLRRATSIRRWPVGDRRGRRAFASTLASQGLIRLIERDRSLWPYAAYRTGLAALILLKRGSRAGAGLHPTGCR